MSSKYNIGKVTHQGRPVRTDGSTAIGPGASVTVNGRRYTVPPDRMGVTVHDDGTVEYF